MTTAPTRYRKKPVVIEAVQFTSETDLDDLYSWVTDNGGALVIPSPATYLTIPTLEGPMRVSRGDYIIRGVQGEFYPCKPDIFTATYEEATP